MTDPSMQNEPEQIEPLLPPHFLRNPVHLLAFGFGSGAVNRAPGTWGSLAAIPFYGLLMWLPLPAYWCLVAVFFLVGIWLCGKTAADLKVHDHGGIVWDEFVGMWIVLGLHPQTLEGLLLAFVAFRFFDVLKPWPINWIDEHTPGGLGIMIDDVIAGFMAMALLYVVDKTLIPFVL